jgi:hypothetical protein
MTTSASEATDASNTFLISFSESATIGWTRGTPPHSLTRAASTRALYSTIRPSPGGRSLEISSWTYQFRPGGNDGHPGPLAHLQGEDPAADERPDIIGPDAMVLGKEELGRHDIFSHLAHMLPRVGGGARISRCPSSIIWTSSIMITALNGLGRGCPVFTQTASVSKAQCSGRRAPWRRRSASALTAMPSMADAWYEGADALCKNRLRRDAAVAFFGP